MLNEHKKRDIAIKRQQSFFFISGVFFPHILCDDFASRIFCHGFLKSCPSGSAFKALLGLTSRVSHLLSMWMMVVKKKAFAL